MRLGSRCPLRTNIAWVAHVTKAAMGAGELCTRRFVQSQAQHPWESPHGPLTPRWA